MKTDNLISTPRHKVILPFFYGISLGFFLMLVLMFYQNGNNYTSLERSLHALPIQFKEEKDLDKYLFLETRVMCVVKLGDLKDLETRLFYITETWIKRCNRYIFYFLTEDSQEDVDLIMEAENIDEEIFPLKDELDLLELLEKSDEFQAADWFLITPIESFIVLENLRYMLYQFESNWPLFFAHKESISMKTLEHTHIFSKASIIKLSEKCTRKTKAKSKVTDTFIFRCMSNLGVKKLGTFDLQRREAFFLDNPDNGGIFPINETTLQFVSSCCSDKLIAIQGITDVDLFKYHYFIYKVRAIGFKKSREDELPEKFMKHLNLK